MILEKETYEKFGYYPSDLKPHSGKRILAACDECGKIRETSKNGYRSLCNSCAQKGEKHHNFGKHLPEETRRKISEARKGEKNPFFGKHPSEETRRKMSEAQKGEKNHNFGKHLSEETKKRQSESRIGKNCGENNPNWKGGISFEPYCPKFNSQFKEYIREKFGRACFLCGKTETEEGQRLSVHHVNYNKQCGCDGDRTCQFVPLCRSCNSKVNFHREMWETKIKTEMRNTLNGWYI
jgi:hypothetical protein